MGYLKVLIVSETYPPQLNGCANFSERIALGLAHRGHKVHVIAPGVRFKNEIEKNSGVTVFRMKSVKIKKINPYFRSVFPLNLEKEITRIISDFNPDIIHIQNHFVLGKKCLKIAQKENIPIIGTTHFMPENLLEYIPRVLEKKISKVLWKDFVSVYSKLDYVTSPSQAAKVLVKSVGLKNNISVISNGVAIPVVQGRCSTQKDLSVFQLEENIPTFVFVGRLEIDKNIDLILRATKVVLRTKKIQVLIVGKGKDEQRFKDLKTDLGLANSVIFTGEINDTDLQMVLRRADVYIASGSAELQGIAVMEAMANCLPVLALNAVALPELVQNGVNGFLFEHNEEDLAKKMVKILCDKDTLEKMAQQSCILIQKHDHKNIVKEFETVYKKVIKSKCADVV